MNSFAYFLVTLIQTLLFPLADDGNTAAAAAAATGSTTPATTGSSASMPSSADLALWLDADILTGDDRSAITSWAPAPSSIIKAPAIAWVQPDSGRGPTLNYSLSNGHKAVSFSGSTCFTIENAPLATHHTIYMVLRATDSDQRMLLEHGEDQGFWLYSDFWWPYRAQRDGRTHDFKGVVDNWLTPGVWQVIRAIYDGNELRVHQNGAQLEFSAEYGDYVPDKIFTSPLFIGCRSQGGIKDLFFEGEIADILIYDRVLKETELTQLDDFLKSKHGLSYSYPLNHIKPMKMDANKEL